MSAALEQDLLQQDWSGEREVFPGLEVYSHIRFRGDEAFVTLEAGEDEATRCVFYGPVEAAERWLDALTEELSLVITSERMSVWATRLDEGAQQATRYAALGFGDLETGYGVFQARLRHQRSAETITVKVTETRERTVTLQLSDLPDVLREQLTDGILSDLSMADRTGVALIAGALADKVLVPVTGDRVERHAEQVFTR